MEYQIRKASKADLPGILEIVNHEIQHSASIYDYAERSLEQQTAWFQEKQNNHYPVWVAETKHQILGFGTYGIFRPKEGYKFCVEHSIYIHHEHQGKGIGKQMMTQLIRSAQEQNIHSMIAGIDASNQGSIDFHKQFGFIETGTLKEVGFKFGKWLDLTFMQLTLPLSTTQHPH